MSEERFGGPRVEAVVVDGFSGGVFSLVGGVGVE